jgi:monofunctional biosynthetic peptidoglycan transglycosylase
MLWIGLLTILVADAAYLTSIWPDWSALERGSAPRSNFMERYAAQRDKHPDWPPLRFQPVPLATIPRVMQRAAVVAEDARFYEHAGFDPAAIREAIDYNLAQGRVVYGASTISQQTAKNLFLHPGRDPLRKWHETVLTLAMEYALSKQRILELYLNTAEFGRGVYGVQAAAQYYWGIPASALTARQAAELAACLPSPVLHNPATRTRTFLRRADKITRRLS